MNNVNIKSLSVHLPDRRKPPQYLFCFSSPPLANFSQTAEASRSIQCKFFLRHIAAGCRTCPLVPSLDRIWELRACCLLAVQFHLVLTLLHSKFPTCRWQLPLGGPQGSTQPQGFLLTDQRQSPYSVKISIPILVNYSIHEYLELCLIS